MNCQTDFCFSPTFSKSISRFSLFRSIIIETTTERQALPRVLWLLSSYHPLVIWVYIRWEAGVPVRENNSKFKISSMHTRSFHSRGVKSLLFPEPAECEYRRKYNSKRANYDWPYPPTNHRCPWPISDLPCYCHMSLSLLQHACLACSKSWLVWPVALIWTLVYPFLLSWVWLLS